MSDKKDYNIIDAAKDLVTGNLELSDTETIVKRNTICDGCEAKDKLANMCTACGCFLPAKVRIKKSTCPWEKW